MVAKAKPPVVEPPVQDEEEMRQRMDAAVQYTAQLKALVQASRESFVAFILLMYPPGHSQYVLGKLHAFLASLVQGMADGTEGNRVSVSVPPQHGKSSLLTVLAGAWLLGRFPGISIAITGAVGSLLTDFSKRVRSIVTDGRYKWVFPDTEPVFGSNRSDHWKLTNKSEICARAAGSRLIGRRVDWLIIDDPHKGRDEAESELQRQRVRDWYFSDCFTRLSPNAKIMVVATRWHPEDLIGHLTSDEYISEMRLLGQPGEIYRRIVIEALCEHPERDPIGRKQGEALSPELGRNEKFLHAVCAAIPSYEWRSQFQGDPKAKSGNAVDVARLRKMPLATFEALRRNPDSDLEFLRGWDLAITEKSSADYAAGPLLAYSKEQDHLYIVDMFRKQISWAKLRAQISKMAHDDHEQYGLNRIGVESVGLSKIGFDEIRKDLMGSIKVHEVVPHKDKLVRAQPWINKLEAGRVTMIEGPWNKAFIDELETFPAGSHDDQVDGISAGWEVVNKRKALLIA